MNKFDCPKCHRTMGEWKVKFITDKLGEISKVSRWEKCSFCQGEGEVDWVEYIVGKKDEDNGNIQM